MQGQLLRALGRVAIHPQDFIHDSNQSVKRRLHVMAAINRNVPVKNLLQYFGIGDEPLTLADQLF
jgi:hypothetical protein